MHNMATKSFWIAVTVGIILFGSAATAQTAATISIKPLITVKLPVDLSPVVDAGLAVTSVPAEGWVKGAVTGNIPSGARDRGYVVRTYDSKIVLNAHIAIETNDHEMIYMEYSGYSENADQLCSGEGSNQTDCYLLSAPTFKTTSEKYAWLNSVQLVGRMIEFSLREGYLIYDLFAVTKVQQEQSPD